MKEALLILIGVVIGGSIVIAPQTHRLIAYIRPTIEGKDGKLSFKRATALLCAVLFVVAFFYDLISDKTVSDTLLYAITTILLGSMGITSWDSVQHFKKQNSHQQTPAEEGQVPQHNNER